MFTKRRVLIAVFILLFLLIGTVFLTFVRNSPDKNFMTFEVAVPRNTPTDDIVFILTASGEHQMQKTSTNVWTIKLSQNDLNPGNDGVAYRYDRNGFGFNTAEFLKDDKQETLRKVAFKGGSTQKDTVERWRWFPAGSSPVNLTTQLAPTGSFLPRLNGQNFLSGQIIEDLYDPTFHPFFGTTATRLKQVGYNFVEIDPPWQWTEENSLPKVENQYKTSPNYPDDATLKEEITAYKKQGLTVAVSPQLCCTEISTENRSNQWWDAYFSETTKFLVHMATISQETGVDYFHYYVGNDYQGTDRAERYTQMFGEIRKVFSGKVGGGVWNFGEDAAIIPSAEDIPWGKSLDYFEIAIDHPLAKTDNPTADELANEAGKMLDAAKSLYTVFGTPILLRTTYFAVAQTWRGNSFYSISDPPWINASESDLQTGKYKQSGEDQARVVNAYFRAIESRPWVIGFSQFGYTHWDNPLASDLSVRDKQAEDLWKKWNKIIFNSS